MNDGVRDIQEILNKKFKTVDEDIAKFADNEKKSGNNEWNNVRSRTLELIEIQFEMVALKEKVQRKIDKGYCTKDVIIVTTRKLQENPRYTGREER